MLGASWLNGDLLNGPVLAPQQATNKQIGVEADLAAQHFGNNTPASNVWTQYVVLSPSGTNPGGFPLAGFCAWHDFTRAKDIGPDTPGGAGNITTTTGTFAVQSLWSKSDNSGTGGCVIFYHNGDQH